MMGGTKAHYDGIVAFSQTDFTEDLKKITVPALVMHSEDDQIGIARSKLTRAFRTACPRLRPTRLRRPTDVPERCRDDCGSVALTR
jgi:pimeloyl-ACP methyl ester carboxylesterase